MECVFVWSQLTIVNPFMFTFYFKIKFLFVGKKETKLFLGTNERKFTVLSLVKSPHAGTENFGSGNGKTSPQITFEWLPRSLALERKINFYAATLLILPYGSIKIVH